MIALFENWREKREKIGKWLMLTSILLLCLLQTFTLLEILHNTKALYEEEVISILVDKANQLCLTKSSSASFTTTTSYT